MQKKRIDRWFSVGLVGALVVLFPASDSHAAPSCHGLTATAVAFGSYDVYSGATKVIPGTIAYNCPPPIPNLSVTIDAGLHPTAGKRAMQLGTGSDLLLYDIFRDATCLIRWDPTVSTPEPDGSQTLQFYACLGPGQDVSVGNYSDTITVTFNF